jgi:hypothetical protein
MNTFIIDKNNGKIVLLLDGPASQHTVAILSYAPEIYAVVEDEGNSYNRMGKLVDGSWQIVEDVEKILENARNIKILEIKKEKRKALAGGMDVSGEENDGGSWVPATLNLSFSGAEYEVFRKLAERHLVNAKTKPTDEDGKLLRGRPSCKVLLPGKKRLSFSTAAEVTSFVELYQDKLSLADIIENEKITAIYEAQELSVIENYDATTGWSELNGS